MLSTYYENVGDDLVRYGVQHQIASVLGETPRWRHVSKSNRLSLSWPISRWTHAPVSRMSPRRQRRSMALARLLERGGGVVPDKLRAADTFVVAGTPIFYFVGDYSFLDLERMHGADWPNAIFAKRIEHERGLRLIALGVGSIYEGRPEDQLANHPDAAAFIQRFVARSSLVTTRDAATDALVRCACPSVQTAILRSICPAFWAREQFAIPVAPRPKRVSISLSLESVNWDLSGPRESIVEARLRAFDLVLRYFRERRYDVDLIAHNEYGIQSGSAIAGHWGVRAPRTVDARGLIESVSSAEVVATWRVHGALAARSAGRPALLLRTDSRWQMAADVGARVLDDRTASPSELVAALDALREAAETNPQETLADADAIRAREFERIRGPLLDALSR
jgi:polysaccharide pyruvyl transferase